ncbi:MAG: DNA repair and recombination protein RadB [archaeon]
MKISSGSEEFDYWLGGYEKGIITTFYGPAGSGKSNFCLMAAAKQALQGNKVVFIDTEGGFSIDRLQQLIPDQYIDNIILLKPTNFTEQILSFEKLLGLLDKKIALIIVDSMVMLYRLKMGEANQTKDLPKVTAVNRALVKQLRVLNEIARKNDIPVLITNQVYREFLPQVDFEAGKQPGVQPVAGDILRYWSKCILELQNLEKSKKRAILRKHRSLPTKQFTFRILNSGIEKIKFKLFH